MSNYVQTALGAPAGDGWQVVDNILVSAANQKDDGVGPVRVYRSSAGCADLYARLLDPRAVGIFPDGGAFDENDRVLPIGWRRLTYQQRDGSTVDAAVDPAGREYVIDASGCGAGATSFDLGGLLALGVAGAIYWWYTRKKR